MAFQLAELALLDTNLQTQHPIGRRPTDIYPSTGHAVCLLHCIASARLDGGAKDSLDSGRDRQED